MKIALLLSGQIRSFLDQPTMLNAIRQVGYTVDCFAQLLMNDPSIPAFREFWKQPPEGFKLRALQMSEDRELSEAGIEESPYCVKHSWHGISSLQAVLRHIAGSASAGAMLRQAEVQDDCRYDWIIKTRYDIKFLRPMEQLATLASRVYFPAHDNCNGYNDKFSFGPSEEMEIHAQLFHAIPHLAEAGMLFHPESMLKAHMDLNGIVPGVTRAITRVNRYGIQNLVTWDRRMGDTLTPEYLPDGTSTMMDLSKTEAISWDGQDINQLTRKIT